MGDRRKAAGFSGVKRITAKSRFYTSAEIAGNHPFSPREKVARSDG